jgi:GNAT superfamily N-acetyltransferase
MPGTDASQFGVEPLRAAHDRPGFSCGVAALDTYLHKQAHQDVRKRVAAVFVLTPDGGTVAGFYSLSAFAFRLAELPAVVSKHLPKYPLVPATLLGRLAISKEHRGRGLGEFLLLDALDRAWRHSYSVVFFAVVVDAKGDAARAFYHHYGFIAFPDSPARLFLPMASIERLFV